MAYGNLLADVVQSSTVNTPPRFNDGNGTQVGTLCRAWVNFNGTTSPGTVRTSFNVSSVTRNATGDYTLTFTNALADANYALTGMSGNNTTSLACVVQPYNLAAPSTTSVRIQSVRADGTMDVNPPICCVAIFR